MYCNLFLIIIVCLLVSFIILDKTFESFISQRLGASTRRDSPNILILTISYNGDDIRWNLEKNIWIQYFKPKKQISLELIECDDVIEPFLVNKYQCIESFTPGIFQKTILSIQSNLNKYDWFVRTNLSTFVIQERLQTYINFLRINTTQPTIYHGVYCHADSWVGGWGIIMNKSAVEILVQEGLKKSNFWAKKADDVLIGNILKKQKIYCNTPYNKSPLSYIWDYSLTIDKNISEINKRPTVIFIRMTNRNIERNSSSKKEYLDALHMLYKIYG